VCPQRLERAEERRLAAIAARQHGVLTSAQLASAGVGQRGVSRRVADGRLRRLHRGVFLMGPLTGPWTRQMAAVLACGARAALSHRSAAALWGFHRPWLGVPEVTVLEGGSRGGVGVRVYRTTRLDRRETRRREGVPVTAPARTLLDIAALIPERDLARAVEEAQVLRLVTPRAMLAQAGRGRPGSAALRVALQAQFEPSLTRSEAEARLLQLIRGAGLPAPETNAHLLGYEVDFLWRSASLVVEVDGFAYHSTREAFERDRRRDARLQAAGFRIVRFTYRQIVADPDAVIACLDRHITVQ
jgi:very-short-patch-repair endonuclease